MTLAVPTIPIERFELDCGAKLVVSRREGAPVCAVQFHLRGGHSVDPKERAGTAFLTGSLVDQGTREHTEEELAVLLENAGGSLHGGPTGISGSIARAHWKLLLQLASECATVPVYPAEKVKRERKRLLDRLLVERDDPRVQAAILFRRLVYGDHWLGQPNHGTLESVPRIQRKHLADFHARNWCGERLLIAFCGDVDPLAVKRFLDEALRGLPRGKSLGPPDVEFPPLEPRRAVFHAERQQVHVLMGHLGVRRTDPDYAALVVMDHVLGTGPGFTSRISRKLRDEEGLAYSVDAAIHTSAGVLPGTFTAYIGTSPQHVRRAVHGFQDEIRRIQEQRVSKAELELAKSYLTGSFALGYERAGRRVTHMVASERCGLPDGHLEDLVRGFAEVTAADVMRVARAHLHPDSCCLVAAGPITERELERIQSRRRSA